MGDRPVAGEDGRARRQRERAQPGDDGRYIVRQTGKETSVSLETVKMVEGLAGPGVEEVDS